MSLVLDAAADRLTADREAAYDRNDPTAVLLAEHDWLREAVAQLKRCVREYEGGAPAERVFGELREIHGRMRPLLREHIAKEEVCFPPLDAAVRGRDPGDVVVEGMYGEHDAIEIKNESMERLLREASAEPKVVASSTGSFERALVIHLDNEEEWVFPLLEELLDDETRASIAAGMRRVEREGR